MSVIRRLPRYYRFISELADSGEQRISSGKLAELMNVTASQIRQDFNCFGGFGQQGYGYSISYLKSEMENILGLNKVNNAIILGAGNLGKAVALHINFAERGFNTKGIFETNPNIIGTKINDIEVMPESQVDEFIKNNDISIAMLCIPRQSVATIIDRLYNCGIKAYWNFSHFDIARKYSDTVVENVHMTDSLMTLSYRMNEKLKSEEKTEE
ncbi:MAG: redox-sensing transcriptional repressor Rex [Ruminococcus sp.]|nr:redox-sensing transcriptional repressor Rex [Ruminococcus sp.]